MLYIKNTHFPKELSLKYNFDGRSKYSTVHRIVYLICQEKNLDYNNCKQAKNKFWDTYNNLSYDNESLPSLDEWIKKMNINLEDQKLYLPNQSKEPNAEYRVYCYNKKSTREEGEPERACVLTKIIEKYSADGYDHTFSSDTMQNWGDYIGNPTIKRDRKERKNNSESTITTRSITKLQDILGLNENKFFFEDIIDKEDKYINACIKYGIQYIDIPKIDCSNEINEIINNNILSLKKYLNNEMDEETFFDKCIENKLQIEELRNKAENSKLSFVSPKIKEYLKRCFEISADEEDLDVKTIELEHILRNIFENKYEIIPYPQMDNDTTLSAKQFANSRYYGENNREAKRKCKRFIEGEFFFRFNLNILQNDIEND